MSKNEKTDLVPSLRFPSFSKEWKSIFFGNVFDFQQTNTFSRNQMNTKKGKVRNIHYGDVLIKYGYVLSDISTVPFINDDVCLDKYNRNSYLQNGDVVIADTAEDLTAGKALEIQNVKCDVLAGLHTMLCRPNEQAASGYWGYYINSPAYHNSIIPLITGSKVSSISKSNIVKTSVVTTDFEEQQKIADCLSSLDDLIAAEAKKLEALKAHKKGLMQKLFPAEGKTVPEWRFPEFRGSGEWNKKTIGSSCTSFSGGTPDTSKREYYDGNIPFIRSAEIDRERTELYITKAGLNNSSAKMVEIGDVLVALYGANSGEVSLSKINGAINQAILCLRHETNNTFVYQYLFHKKLWIISTFIQGGQGNLSGDIVKSIELYFPKPEEQKKIADCLSGADALITEQAKKIEALKIHKKGLMQGLFPSIEEVVK